MDDDVRLLLEWCAAEIRRHNAGYHVVTPAPAVDAILDCAAGVITAGAALDVLPRRDDCAGQ